MNQNQLIEKLLDVLISAQRRLDLAEIRRREVFPWEDAYETRLAVERRCRAFRDAAHREFASILHELNGR